MQSFPWLRINIVNIDNPILASATLKVIKQKIKKKDNLFKIK